MAQTHPIRLTQDEVNRQARKFFGPDGLGLEVEADELQRLQFRGREGFVEIQARPDTNNQVRLTIEHDSYEQEIQQFRQMLARQAAAGTRAG